MLVHRMVKNVKNSKVLEKIRTRDMKVTITIEGEDVTLPNEPAGIENAAEPAPEELIPFEGENYKGFEIKQDEETGEFDVYAPGFVVGGNAKCTVVYE